MKLRYRFAMQKVGSGIVAVAIEEDALNYNELMRMNSTGAYILTQLKDNIHYNELEERMLRKYDTDTETVNKILIDFLCMLSGKELLLDDNGVLINEIKMHENAGLY